MKRLFAFLCLCLLGAACKKNTENMVFSQRPEERVKRSIAQVDSLLGASPNGWIATLGTQGGGGYGFYMTFDRPNQAVTMYSDLDDQTSTTAKNSTYRIKGDGGATLIFDTYNYISKLADPTPSTMSGAIGHGFYSDVEFNFDHDKGDTLVFIGKKYRQEFKLLKASAAQQAAYKAGDYKKAINQMVDFFDNTSFPYVEVASGSKTYKLGVNLNTSNDLYSGKTVDFTGIVPGDTLGTNWGKYAFTIKDAPILDSGVKILGTIFKSIAMKSATSASVYDKAGKEYPVKSSLQPLVPLYLAIGPIYTSLQTEYPNVLPGTTKDGIDIVNYYHNNVSNVALLGYPTLRPFNYGTISLVFDATNHRMQVRGTSSQNGEQHYLQQLTIIATHLVALEP